MNPAPSTAQPTHSDQRLAISPADVFWIDELATEIAWLNADR
jgi:hypothetical protein